MDPVYASAVPAAVYYKKGLPFDLLPVGELELTRKELVWPDGTVMGVDGFELLLELELPTVAGGARIHLATIPVVALLKMVAWLDRLIVSSISVWATSGMRVRWAKTSPSSRVWTYATAS
ncbi:MAG: hypothetical protein ABW352_15190 [Polyangiales bacterium]